MSVNGTCKVLDVPIGTEAVKKGIAKLHEYQKAQEAFALWLKIAQGDYEL